MFTQTSRVVLFAATTTRKSGNRYAYTSLFSYFAYVNLSHTIECLFNDRKFFLDAVPMTGTPASVAMLTKMITDNEVTGIEADMWMTTLAFIPSPSKDMIREVLVRLANVVDKAALSFKIDYI